MGSEPSKSIRGSAYLDEARTGDIILFESHGHLANMVRCATCSAYSHIGMVVRLPTSLTSNANDLLYLWHSPSDTIRKVPDLLSDPPRAKDGPQLISLRRLIHYVDGDTKALVRKIRLPESHPWHSGTVALDSPLMKWMRQEHTKIYERSYTQLALSAYDGPLGRNTEDTDQYFCSELQAETYSQFDIFDGAIPSSEFVPMDFAWGGMVHRYLIDGVRFSREYELLGPIVSRTGERAVDFEAAAVVELLEMEV